MPDLHLRLQDAESETEPVQPNLAEEEALLLLERAEFTGTTLVPWGSNYTFAVALEQEGGEPYMAIYKPMRGERPLWDFAHGTLYLREHAAYLLSHRLGWGIVPPTVIRVGLHGVGSLQLYIEPDPAFEDDHRFWGQKRDEIERIALFDLITNNADRKLSHCLINMAGEIRGIDHGLTFNVDPKLRTILWQYTDVPINIKLLRDMVDLDAAEAEVRAEFAQHLAPEELDALYTRVRALLESGHFPELDPRINIPYGWW